MSSQNNDYSWVGWLFGIGIFILIIFSFSSSSSNNAEQIQQDKESVISQFLDDIENQYSDLTDGVDNLVGEIESECDWLYENISSTVADYCYESINDVQGNNSLSSSNITYDETAELNDILDDIADQANSAYNDLLERANNAQSAFLDQCDYIMDNISYDVGDYCSGSINGIDYSGDPFSASDYYE